MTVKVGVDEILPVRGVTGRLQVVQNVVVNRRDLRGSVGNGIGEGIVKRNLRSAEDSLDVLRESVHVSLLLLVQEVVGLVAEVVLRTEMVVRVLFVLALAGVMRVVRVKGVLRPRLARPRHHRLLRGVLSGV